MRKIFILLLMIVSCPVIYGCLSNYNVYHREQEMVSGIIGCAPADITITDFDSGFYSTTWTAECGGDIYYCRKVPGGSYADCAKKSH